MNKEHISYAISTLFGVFIIVLSAKSNDAAGFTMGLFMCLGWPVYYLNKLMNWIDGDLKTR